MSVQSVKSDLTIINKVTKDCKDSIMVDAINTFTLQTRRGGQPRWLPSSVTKMYGAQIGLYWAQPIVPGKDPIIQCKLYFLHEDSNKDVDIGDK